MAKALTIDPAVMRRLRELPKTAKVDCLLALCDITATFGQPHLHSQLAIRKLGNKLFECRAGLALRFILQDRPTDIYLSFLGNHDEVKALLKAGQYR